MSEFSAARAPRGADKAAVTAEKRPFFKKLLDLVVPSPGSRDQLIESLAVAENKELIEPESRMMLEGVIRMADMTAGDVMVASRHMDLLDIDAPFEEMLHVIIHTGHSRFPVFEERRDNVIGILMAKDLLKLQRSPDLNLRTLLRPAFFVPESKALNDLLRDFRTNRNHIAIVIDEFGHTAGLLTLEDVLEEIVGEIEDEFDERRRRVEHLHARRRQPARRRRRHARRGQRVVRRPPADRRVRDHRRPGRARARPGAAARRVGDDRRPVFSVMLARGGAVRWFKVTRAAEEALGSDGA